MKQLDGSAMDQVSSFQYSAKGNYRRAAIAAANDGEPACMRQTGRERERVAHRGTDSA